LLLYNTPASSPRALAAAWTRRASASESADTKIVVYPEPPGQSSEDSLGAAAGGGVGAGGAGAGEGGGGGVRLGAVTSRTASRRRPVLNVVEAGNRPASWLVWRVIAVYAAVARRPALRTR